MTLGREKTRAGRGAVAILGMVLFLAGGCAKDEPSVSSDFAACSSDMAGTPWIPAVPGAASSNHDASVEIIKTTHTASISLLGLGQGAHCSSVTSGSCPSPPSTCPDTASRFLSFNFDVSQDLGANGSISLVAEPYGFPTELAGSAWPMLVSLKDSNGKEWVGFDLASSSSCLEEGFFTCDCSGYCAQNPGCTTSSNSAFKDWSHWRQNNIPAFGYASTNTFPTCNWTGGSPTCHFAEGSGFLDSGKLPVGTYTAKYVLLATSYSKLSSNYKGGVKLSVIRKKDATAAALPPSAAGNGAFDINVVIIGEGNVRSARSSKGKANLNALFEHVQKHFEDSSNGAGLKVGRVTSYEVCGNAYSTTDFTEVGQLLEGGSSLVLSSSEGRAINVFLVSSIQYDDANLTILGASGSIGGSMINGTGSSGVVFSTFDRLDSFNSGCVGATCLIEDQEEDFIEMGNTVSHELGHFLGLNHLSEMDGSRSDPLPDTPTCGTTTSGGKTIVTHGSCRASGSCQTDCAGYDGITTFCPTASSCEFNHVMWYTVKKYNTSTGDGDAHMFSPNSATVLNFNPIVQ